MPFNNCLLDRAIVYFLVLARVNDMHVERLPADISEDMGFFFFFWYIVLLDQMSSLLEFNPVGTA